MIVSTPQGISYNCFSSFLSQSHLLVAGASGSGKSTLINGLIWQALYKAPNRSSRGVGFILIDPKRVELKRYEDLPHTILRAVTKDEIKKALDYAINEMEDRYTDMERRGLRLYDGHNIYIVIDEYADICDDKSIVERVIKLAQLGRASKIHLWVCTQRPTRDVITGRIKVNLDAQIALHCSCAQDSRNIIGIKGAENLPLGKALYRCPQYFEPLNINVPYISDEELDKRVNYWLNITHHIAM